MNEKKPKVATVWKAASDLFRFFYKTAVKPPTIILPASGVQHGSLLTMPLLLKVDPCCLESLFVAINIGSADGMLDPHQQFCLVNIGEQIQQKFDPSLVPTIGQAVQYAVYRHQQRQRRRLFDAASAAPSIN